MRTEQSEKDMANGGRASTALIGIEEGRDEREARNGWRQKGLKSEPAAGTQDT